MKKMILIAAVAVSVSMPVTAGESMFGGLGDMVMKARGMFKETVPSKSFAVEADGANLRGYAFDHPANQNFGCIFLAGTDKGGLSCIPKGSQ